MNNHATLVYRYAARADLPPEAIEELRRAHTLANTLVELDRGHDETVAAIWADHPDITRAQHRVNDAAARRDAERETAKQHRQATRNRKVPPELADRLRQTRTELRDAREGLKTAKNTAYPTLKPAMVEARQAHRAAVKATYRDAVDTGLYWASYNEVLDRHKRAQQAVIARRSQGRPSEMRFRRWDGTGTLAVQLQRQADDPPRSPATLADTERGKWRNVATLIEEYTPEQWAALDRRDKRGRARHSLRFRVGSGEHAAWVRLPIVVHRPLPDDADIAMVRITRSRVGPRFQVHVSLIARVPAPEPVTEGPPAAVHLGWRALRNGDLRVAVVAGAGHAPGNVADVVRSHGDWHEVVIPAAWRDLQAHTEKLRATRGEALETLRAELLRFLDRHPDAAEHLAEPAQVRRWRAPGRFARLALDHRDDPPAGLADLVAHIEAWRRQDKHLWTWEANERRKLAARRLDAWRRVAAWVTTGAGLVAVDMWDVADLSAVPDVDTEDDYQARAARANRVLASPGELRTAVERAADRRGVTTTRPELEVSATHHPCGTRLDGGQRADAVMVWCSACETMVDQDHNALRHLLHAARGDSAA